MQSNTSTTQFNSLPPELQKLHDLYPDMNYDQLHEAWYNLERYLRVAMRIHRRMSKTDQSEGDPFEEEFF
jgi:hypothetical protein